MADSDDDEPADDDDENLSERLEGININDPDAVWERLTANERKEFEKIIQTDELYSIIPTYEPWWCTIKLIEEITTPSSSSSSSSKNNVPQIVPAIKDFNTISSKAPAKCIEYNLVNILSAYALIARCFNGEHLHNADETATLMISLSENLLTMANFPNESMAIDSVVNLAKNFDMLSNNGENIYQIIENDVKKIIGGYGSSNPIYVLSALSDIYRLFKLAAAKEKKNLTSNNNVGGEFKQKFLANLPTSSLDKTKLNTCLRKIEYFLSYAKDILK